MKYEFWTNDAIDMRNIVDSMQLDSNQTIATLRVDGMEASLEIQGAVKVWWNEKAGEPEEGEYYTLPSEFPDKLKRLIADQSTADEGHWTYDPRLAICENNWFEIFVGKINDPVPYADVVDVEESTPAELFSLLLEYIEERKKA